MKIVRSVAAFVAVALLAARASADDASEKQACVDAATRGQIAARDSKFVDAVEALKICAAPSCPEVVREKCGWWLVEAEAKAGWLTVTVNRDDGTPYPQAQIFVDEKKALRDERTRVNPGSHSVRVVAEDGVRSSQTTIVREGESQRVVITLARPAVVDDKPVERPAASSGGGAPLGVFVLAGVGAVGLAGFGIFGLQAQANFDDARRCEPDCPHAQVQRIRDQSLIADVSLATGIVALAGAAVLYFVTAGSSSRAAPKAALRR